jgi:antitoxin FitA
MQAANHGRSMEEEAREILRRGLPAEPAPIRNLATAIREIIEPLGGVELEIPPRDDFPSPPDFT